MFKKVCFVWALFSAEEGEAGGDCEGERDGTDGGVIRVKYAVYDRLPLPDILVA